MKHFQLVSDYACPWCYLVNHYLLELKGQGIHYDIKPVTFQLVPDAPQEGGSLLAIYPKEHILGTYRRLAEKAEKYGITFDEDAKLYNTGLAHRIAAYMAEKGKLLEFSHEVYKGYFETAKNIAVRVVLTEMIRQVGEDPNEAFAYGDSQEAMKRQKEDLQLVRRYAVRSVPTIITENGELLQGIDGAQDIQDRL